jgi:hypothetical protein
MGKRMCCVRSQNTLSPDGDTRCIFLPFQALGSRIIIIIIINYHDFIAFECVSELDLQVAALSCKGRHSLYFLAV